MDLSFKKAERLKSKRIIDDLFTSGKVIASYPVKVFWLETELPKDVPVQFGVSVPKRRFKHAVDRNRIKRQMREAVRLKKSELVNQTGMKSKQLALMILYTGKEVTEYKLIERKISEAFNRLIQGL